jgi:hypothetical protein
MAAPRQTYEPELSLRDARALYFKASGFGDDGGYGKPTVRFELGPIPCIIPNPPARVAAVRFHDLHHIVTGYPTDWRGEFEIACFEIAAGCGSLWFAWAINLGGVAGGLLFLPRRSVRAWALGRATGGLYSLPFADALLERSVGEVTATLGLDSADPQPALVDWLGLIATGGAVVALSLAPLVAALGLAWWLLA